MASLWRRLLSGNELRKSRFHDEKGNLVDVAGMVYAPAALVTSAAKLCGVRLVQPMISFRAARVIAGLLTPRSKVLEFGSGYSTPWLAARCGELVSIEDDPAWFTAVEGLLARGRAGHVRHELREVARYCALDEFANEYFDFVLVDGTDRTGCVDAAFTKLRPGGWIYLDNSDKDMTRPDGDLRRAEALLLAEIERRGGEFHYFTDFSPTNFFAEQGLLARL